MLTKIYRIFASKRLAILVLFLHVLLITIYFISDSFTGSGFDESVVYLTRTGLDGFGLDGYIYLLTSTIFLLLLAVILIIKLLNSTSLFSTGSRLSRSLLNALFMVSIFFQPVSQVLLFSPQSIFSDAHQLSIHMELDTLPEFNPIQLPNIVYLYAESLERTFLDETHFPGLTPNLKKLEKKALTFTNLNQVYGTGWTIAGMVASQCGFPLSTTSSSSDPSSFLPEANCLGDILKTLDYHLTYVGGASLKFAGKGNFYQSHQFDHVFGLDYFVKKNSNPIKISQWGVNDSVLFPELITQFFQLSKTTHRFALFGLTLDSHPPEGFPSEVCESHVYEANPDPVLQAIHCSDALIGDFVNTILESPFAKNTIVIIGSDHYIMGSTIYDHLQEIGGRKNLFFIIGDNVIPGEIDKPGSTMDIAPTLLSIFDPHITGLNLGKNLRSNHETIYERSKYPNRDLEIWSRKQNRFNSGSSN